MKASPTHIRDLLTANLNIFSCSLMKKTPNHSVLTQLSCWVTVSTSWWEKATKDLSLKLLNSC